MVPVPPLCGKPFSVAHAALRCNMATLWLLLFLAFAVANWLAAYKNRQSIEYIVKPAALASLLLFALTGSHPGALLAVALLLCLLGDVYMMLPGDYLIAGLSAFLLGHCAYIADLQAPLTLRLACFAAVLALTLPVAARIVLSISAIGLKVGVIAYVCAIALMTGSAIASGNLLASAGALLFLISDSLLAWDLFVKKFPRAHCLVMITYHLGQLGLVLALR